MMASIAKVEGMGHHVGYLGGPGKGIQNVYPELIAWRSGVLVTGV